MLSNVFFKTLRDQRRSLAWWGLGLALLAVMMLAFFPSIEGNEELLKLAEVYPEELMALFGFSDIGQMTTAVGFLNAELFGFMAPLLLLIFAILLGSGAIAGEEGRGTLEILLSEPIRRGRLVFEKFAGMVAATVTLSLALLVVLLVGAPVAGMDIGLMRLVEATASMTLLGLTFGGLAFALGCIIGSRGVAAGIAGGVAVITYLANNLRAIVDFIDPAKWLSPFFYYIDADPLANGLNLAHAGVLVLAIAALAAAAYIGLERRDLSL